MTSELRVDNLKGSTTGGSINVLGEGTSATTNLQQGLCKMWIHFNGTGTIATDDSLNSSGITDVGTGAYTISFTNSMANTSYTVTGAGKEDTSSSHTGSSADRTFRPARVPLATGDVKVIGANMDTSFRDLEEVYTVLHGDLA